MSSLTMDVLYSWRALRKSAGFAAIVILSLGLGIGANAGIFTLLNALVLRDVHAPSPKALVEIGTVGQNGTRRELTYPLFNALRERQTVFSGVVGWTGDRIANVEVNDRLVRAGLMTVTANFHSELGAAPFAGRFFTDGDLNTSNAAVIIGYGFWQRHFGSDFSAIGKTIRIEGAPFTVVGIAPKRFTGLTMTVEPEVAVPLTAFGVVTGRASEGLT